jgi:hypothetical protein
VRCGGVTCAKTKGETAISLQVPPCTCVMEHMCNHLWLSLPVQSSHPRYISLPLLHQASLSSFASRHSPPISLPTTLFRPKRAERWSEESTPGGRGGGERGGKQESVGAARAMTRHRSSRDTFGLGSERLMMWDVIRDVLEVDGHNTCIRVDPAGSVDHPCHGNPTLSSPPRRTPSCDSFLLSTRSEKFFRECKNILAYVKAKF